MNIPLSRMCGILPIAFVFWLTACGSGEPRLRTIGENGAILAFGDSLTYGTGASRETSYPAVLERLTGRRVINAGRPGEESAAGVERLRPLLEEHRPVLVILCHGGNDILRRRARDELKANLERMIADSRAAGAEVLLLGVPDFGVFLTTADVYAAVAQEAGVVLENDILPDVLEDRRLKSDTVHPNAEGYRRIAVAVAELLGREGAL